MRNLRDAAIGLAAAGLVFVGGVGWWRVAMVHAQGAKLAPKPSNGIDIPPGGTATFTIGPDGVGVAVAGSNVTTSGPAREDGWDIDPIEWWVMTLRDAGHCKNGYAVLHAWPPISEDSYWLIVLDMDMALEKCAGKEWYQAGESLWFAGGESLRPEHVLNGSTTDTRVETIALWVPKPECQSAIKDVASRYRSKHSARVKRLIREIKSRA